MPYPELRPSRVERQNDIREITHLVDQFSWYREGFDNLPLEDDEIDERKMSMVQFFLPKRAILYVVGQGIGDCEAVLDNGRLWSLFDYNKRANRDGKHIPLRKPLNEKNLDFFKTQTSPFLHDGDYPIDFDRAYLFNLFGSEYLEVRAKQGETIEKCVLTLSFLPDPREAEKYEIARVYLAENRWCWKSDFLPGFSG